MVKWLDHRQPTAADDDAAADALSGSCPCDAVVAAVVSATAAARDRRPPSGIAIAALAVSIVGTAVAIAALAVAIVALVKATGTRKNNNNGQKAEAREEAPKVDCSKERTVKHSAKT